MYVTVVVFLVIFCICLFVFKQKTAYDMLISDWSSDVCSSDLAAPQVALISAIAQGVLGGNLDWNLIGLGALIGVGVIIVDEVLRAKIGRASCRERVCQYV